jgi:hypothetical protein
MCTEMNPASLSTSIAQISSFYSQGPPFDKILSHFNETKVILVYHVVAFQNTPMCIYFLSHASYMSNPSNFIHFIA